MSGNVRVITTFQFVCPVTTNGVVSTTTLPIGASALPRAIRPTNSASTTQVGGGSGSLTTSLPPEKMPTGFPSATPVTTTILTTLPNGEVSTIVTATMLPPLTTATRTVGIIPFTTTLTVDTFPTPRPVDLDAYLPAYAAKGDGSLITPLYVQSSTNEHIRIFITGALLMLFIRNIFTSIDYLRRTSSRDRTLFWLLLISQLWGPVRFIPVAAGFFNRTADCKAIQIVSYTALEISYSILITFILGMKAYRCLERSKVVLAVVATLQIAAYALYIIGLPTTSVTRELSGDCLNTSTTPFIMAGISVQFVETLFIFLCFLYAVIKSSRRSATQGRMSIALSSVAGIASVVAPIASPQIGETNKPQGTKEKRGWWDYVPDSHVSVGAGGLGGPRFLPENHPSNTQEAADEHTHPVESWRAKIVSAIWKRGDAPNIQSRPVSPGAAAPRKSSIRGDEPIPHPNRGAFGTLSEKQLIGLGANTNHMPDLALVDSRTGLATGIESARTGSGARSRGKTSRGARSITERQTFSGIMRMPKMILLRAVMKDELLYTAMIALTCVLSSIGLVLGAAQSNLLFGGAIWLEINWAVVSLLVMRSYAQVIARQERDAVLQDPSAWNVAIRTEDGLGRSPILRRGAADYGFARAQRVPLSFISRRSDISSRAFYPSPTRRPNTLSVSDYGSAVERARHADESRPSVQPLPATDPDDPFSEFERIVDMPRARDREPGSPVPSSLHGVQTWHNDDEPGPSDSVSQAPGRTRSKRGPPPTVPRRGALADYSIDIGTLSMVGIVPQKSIDRGLPSPHGSGSRDSSAYEPSFIEASPETPIEPRITHS